MTGGLMVELAFRPLDMGSIAQFCAWLQNQAPRLRGSA
jgi:hypothetical protein